jgi:hypothetical protein
MGAVLHGHCAESARSRAARPRFFGGPAAHFAAGKITCLTWRAVAQSEHAALRAGAQPVGRSFELAARGAAAAGCAVAVPSLLAIGEGGPPFWPRVVAAVTDGLAGRDGDQPLVLVAHSNAGVFIPVITAGAGRPVRCSIFADATVPASGDRTPMASEEFLPFLRGLAGPDGRLSRWTDWWQEQDVAPMFPDPISPATAVAAMPGPTRPPSR